MIARLTSPAACHAPTLRFRRRCDGSLTTEPLPTFGATAVALLDLWAHPYSPRYLGFAYNRVRLVYRVLGVDVLG